MPWFFSVAPSPGLSPRVRGNPSTLWLGLAIIGSIPACAGEPVRDRKKSSARWVYPRVCGGTLTTNPHYAHLVGLSPRVRGNRALSLLRRDGSGSIPACAGEPKQPDCAETANRVYPRVCGGTNRKRENHSEAAGLSPRVRGNLYRITH